MHSVAVSLVFVNIIEMYNECCFILWLCLY